MKCLWINMMKNWIQDVYNINYKTYWEIVIVQSLSHVRLFVFHGPQHTRPPCPSLSPGVCSNSCPLNQLCHSTISFCCTLLLLHSIFPSIRVFFPESQVFPTGGQSIGVSALASVLPMNIQDLFPLGWTSWISLQSKGLSRVFSNTTVQ